MSVASDPRFGAVERDYNALKAQLTAGQMTREQFEAALQKLMVQDDSGRYWMMGAESGKWYVYDNQKWSQADPPTSAAAAAPVTPAAAEPTPETRNDALTMASFTPPTVAGGAQSAGAQTNPSFTTPTASETATGAGTTAASEAEARAAGQTMPSFTPPKVSQPSDTERNAAMTMPSFTPPPTPIDKAVTMPSFTPPKVTTPPAATPVKPVSAEAKSGGSRSPVLVIGCLLAGLCIIGVAALALVASGRFGNNPSPTIPPATGVPATAAIATATDTSVPTVAPTVVPATATTAPTTVPVVVPTTAPTTAPSATRAPTVAPQPTATAVPPTATSTNTAVPPTETPPPTPTNTSAPLPTPRPPAVEFPVSFNFVGYEKWGRPDPNNCTTIFNNKDPVRQFKWEIAVTNGTGTPINEADWHLPTAANNEGGAVLLVCLYSKPVVPPGQSARVTVAAYVTLSQYVARLAQKVRNTTYTRCLDAGWKEIPC